MFALPLILAWSSPALAVFPIDESSWVAVQQDGEPITDLPQATSPFSLMDWVGETDAPAGQWAMDEYDAFFRLRLASSPQKSTFGPFHCAARECRWAVLVDTDGDDSNFERVLLLAASGHALQIRSDASTDGWSAATETVLFEEINPLLTGLVAESPAPTSLGGLDNVYLDIAVPHAWLDLTDRRNTVRLALASGFGAASDPLSFDLADGSGLNTLASAWSDPIGLDSDGDGLAFPVEIELGTDPQDSDTDGDGLEDGEEVFRYDTDPLNRMDPDFDLDEDCDGIPDYVDDLFEFEPSADNDGDGIANEYEIEVCGTDPCSLTEDPDMDGVDNEREALCGTDPCAPDTDLDGRWDSDELTDEACGGDADGDGVPDALDPDGPVSGDPTHPDAGPHGLTGGQFTGGGCSGSPRAPVGLGALLFVLTACVSRSRAALLGALSVVLAVGAAPAHGNSIDADRFTPSLHGRTFIGITDPVKTAPGPLGSIFIHHAHMPLVYRMKDASSDDIPLVGDLWTSTTSAGYGFGTWSLGMTLPVHGAVIADTGTSHGQLSDLSIGADVLLRDRRQAPFGIGLTFRADLPSGNEDQWLGRTSPAGTAAINLATGTRVIVAAQVGLTLSGIEELDGLVAGPSTHWRVGTHLPLTKRGRASIEADGEHHILSLAHPGAHAIELAGFGRWSIAPQWEISMGAGSALSRGIGAPAYRLLAGLSMGPQATAPHMGTGAATP